MTILKILQLGHPTLRQRAQPLPKEELVSDRWQTFIDDLIETMHQANGAGLAATQVGELVRICAIEVRANNPRYPEKEPIPLTVLVNPTITELDPSTLTT